MPLPAGRTVAYAGDATRHSDGREVSIDGRFVVESRFDDHDGERLVLLDDRASRGELETDELDVHRFSVPASALEQ